MKKNMNVNNEKGSVLIPALMIMVLLTIMGFSIAATTTMGLKVAVNKKYHKAAFFSAESGLSYVMAKIGDYGISTDYSAPGDEKYFPIIADKTKTYDLSDDQEFNGWVRYLGEGNPPPGSGYDQDDASVGAYSYQIRSSGRGPANANSVINAAFYRIFFTEDDSWF